MNEQTVLACQGLAKAFDSGPARIEVLHDLDFALRRGEQVAIVGSSGSGKSTLMHCLGGLDQPSAGTVNLLGHPFSTLDEKRRGIARNHAIGFVYQFHHLLPEFSALENVAMPLLIRGVGAAEAAARALALLERVGLGRVRVTSPRNSPVVSGSVLRWHVPWSRTRPACWQMNRPAISIARPRMRSMICCST